MRDLIVKRFVEFFFTPTESGGGGGWVLMITLRGFDVKKPLLFSIQGKPTAGCCLP